MRGAGTEFRSNGDTGTGHSPGRRIGRNAGRGTSNTFAKVVFACPGTRNGRGPGSRGRGTGDVGTGEWPGSVDAVTGESLGPVAGGNGCDWAAHCVGSIQKSSKAALWINGQADRRITPTSSTSVATVR